jgi:hypothetical protein
VIAYKKKRLVKRDFFQVAIKNPSEKALKVKGGTINFKNLLNISQFFLLRSTFIFIFQGGQVTLKIDPFNCVIM